MRKVDKKDLGNAGREVIKEDFDEKAGVEVIGREAVAASNEGGTEVINKEIGAGVINNEEHMVIVEREDDAVDVKNEKSKAAGIREYRKEDVEKTLEELAEGPMRKFL